MEKQKYYSRANFTVEAIREACAVFDQTRPKGKDDKADVSLSVKVDDANWTHDEEEEFLADYRRTSDYAYYRRSFHPNSLKITRFDTHTSVDIKLPTRAAIEKV